jgi:hypothetical protein
MRQLVNTHSTTIVEIMSVYKSTLQKDGTIPYFASQLMMINLRMTGSHSHKVEGA